jgi:hypothetical protein
MKRLLTNFLAISSGALLILSSCKKSDVQVTSDGGKAGTLTASSTTIVLDKTKVSDTSTAAVSFSSTAPVYSFKAAVTTTLQIDTIGDNWKNPTSYSLPVNNYNMSFSTPVFNSLLLKLNLPSGTASKVNVRLAFALSPTVVNYSNVLSLTVTPFNLASWVYVPGAYEGSTWPNPGPLEDSLESATGNGIYTGIINFSAGNNQFLITPVKNWNNKWATTIGPVTGTSVTYPVTYNGPNNFYAPAAAGYYIVTLNTNANTLTIVPADFYGIIGSATPGGWSNDTFMKYINDGSGNWVVSLPMTVGEYKFRQSGGWTNSWGPTTSTTSAGGTITDSGPIGDGNLQLTVAGNYTFVLSGMGATPLGTTPPVTTTYTATKQ